MVSFEAEGENAARLALRVLSGEVPEGIALPETSENPYMFDWRQLRRWGIAEDALPPGSVVLDKQPSFWDLHRWRITGVISLCIVEALLIVGLLVQRTNRRRADERFRQAVVASPSGMVMIGRDDKIVRVNAQVEILFGYHQDELIGNPVELLVPERFRVRHPAHRDRFFASPASRPMGAGRELYGRRKDGSEFPMEVGLNPIRTGASSFVLASIIDITERKRADERLRESQRALRALTGRLLQAQEMERRRIARELHDDLNQELALLAVQLDLLSQGRTENGDRFGERMKELSDRVKQLSSSVHGLSTLLHPSKLEQLGLAAAVRGLCKELTQAHGLEIDFAERPMPSSIPADIALCLYRITQEALRNAIKHSGARHSRVELCGDEGGVSLRIVDDGAGFDCDTLKGQEGLGLVSMRERLRLVGGAITIDSRPSAGTRIDVHVPLPPPGQEPDLQPEEAPRSQASQI
jgi:PAS domain S-box-containing protein